MSSKRKVEAPPLPVEANLSAFIRGEPVREQPPQKKPKEPIYVVTIRLPKRLKLPLNRRVLEEDTSLQELGERFFEDYASAKQK